MTCKSNLFRVLSGEPPVSFYPVLPKEEWRRFGRIPKARAVWFLFPWRPVGSSRWRMVKVYPRSEVVPYRVKFRVCKQCSGRVEIGTKCPCIGRKFQPPRPAAKQGSIDAAHFRELYKSIRSGSWAKTNYRAPRNEQRAAISRLYQDFDGGFSISKPTRCFSLTAVEWFIFRFDVSKQYWRSEFDGLMGSRLLLWLGGCDQQKTADRLQISREDLKWLDGEIRKFVYFPARSNVQNPLYLKEYRKMRAGVARDIIRRKKHGYKQGQSLVPQRDKPHSPPEAPTIEGRTMRVDADPEEFGLTRKDAERIEHQIEEEYEFAETD
jgi:hypothetical protein